MEDEGKTRYLSFLYAISIFHTDYKLGIMMPSKDVRKIMLCQNDRFLRHWI